MLFVLGKPHLPIAYKLFMGGVGWGLEGRKTPGYGYYQCVPIYYVMSRSIQCDLWG